MTFRKNQHYPPQISYLWMSFSTPHSYSFLCAEAFISVQALIAHLTISFFFLVGFLVNNLQAIQINPHHIVVHNFWNGLLKKASFLLQMKYALVHLIMSRIIIIFIFPVTTHVSTTWEKKEKMLLHHMLHFSWLPSLIPSFFSSA